MAELHVHLAKLEGFSPFPRWNGTIAAPLKDTRGLCSVLGADGELVVLETHRKEDQDTSDNFLRVLKVLLPAVEKFSSFCQCWTHDGAVVVSAHDKSVVFYSTDDFQVLTRLRLQYSVESMDITKWHHSSDDKKEFVFMVGTMFGVLLYKVSLCNKRGAVSDGAESDMEYLRPHLLARVYDGVAVCVVKFSYDGCTAAIGTMDGRLFLRRLDTHEDEILATFGSAVLSRVLQAPRITSMSFSACNTKLVVATRKGNVYVFTCALETGQWRALASCRGLSANPKPKAGGAIGTNKSATAAQTLVACWGPVFVVCSRAITSRLEMFDFSSGRLLHSLQFAPAALNQWADQQLITGVCGWNLSSTSKLLCHDTSAKVAMVEWPFLDAIMQCPLT